MNTQLDALKTAASASLTSLNGDAPMCNEETMAKLRLITKDDAMAYLFAEVGQFPVNARLMAKMMANCPNDEVMAKLTSMQVDSSCAATDGIGCYHGHNKLIGTSDDSGSDEADRRKLRMFDGVSVQGSTLLAARMRSSMEPFSEGNITKWIKALPEQGA